jgi:hypothetical protein
VSIVIRPADPTETALFRADLAIEVLVRGLRLVAATVEHSPDPRVVRSIALAALRDASRFVELPEVER